ncbi:MAG: phosphotransferase family protein, partial [Thermodesulfobacteriota bacterium]
MESIDQAVEVRKGEAFDTNKVEAFLRDVIPGLEGLLTLRQFPSGASNLTYLVTVGDREMVLRRPPFGTKPKSGHDMHREYTVLKALGPVYPYCPRPLAYTEDPEVMECPFYVMERIPGIVLRRDIPASLGLAPDDVTLLSQNLVKALHELHCVDFQSIGLEDFGKPEGYVERQVTGWIRRFRAARTPDVPDAEEVMAWLLDKMPPDTDSPGLIHNDYKFDNVVLDPDDPLKIIGILDWEMTTLGDPLMDLGGTLAYWVEAGDPEEMQLIRTVPTNAKGMLTRRELVDYYEQISGRSMEHYDFYYCFGLFKLAGICQQIYYRSFHGQTQDERFKVLGGVTTILEKAAMRV